MVKHMTKYTKQEEALAKNMYKNASCATWTVDGWESLLEQARYIHNMIDNASIEYTIEESTFFLSDFELNDIKTISESIRNILKGETA